MKRHGNWLVCEDMSGDRRTFNLRFIREAQGSRDGVYIKTDHPDDDQNWLVIKGTLAEWDREVLGIGEADHLPDMDDVVADCKAGLTQFAGRLGTPVPLPVTRDDECTTCAHNPDTDRVCGWAAPEKTTPCPGWDEVPAECGGRSIDWAWHAKEQDR